MTTRIGIDAGGTLTKIAYWNEQKEMVFKRFHSSDFQKVKEWIESNHSNASICVTGGRAAQLKAHLDPTSKFHISLNLMQR